MILLKDLYENKKVCLLGGGDSSSVYNIDFDSYDLVVGINRIYTTRHATNISVMYNALSKKDWTNVRDMLDILSNQKKFIYLIACPWSKKRTYEINYIIKEKKFCENKKFLYCRNIVREAPVKKRPLTGMAALYHILLSGATSIDLYGFDFYTNKYLDNLPKFNHDRYHDIDANKKFLQDLIVEYPEKINWFL
jgi:hypothetical protein